MAYDYLWPTVNEELPASSKVTRVVAKSVGTKKMNYRNLAHAIGLGSSMAVLLGLVACSSQSIQLIHPQSGAIAECSATGFAIGVSIAHGIVGVCSHRYQNRGYVPLDQLPPEQRASLERRGLLPKIE